MSAETRSLEGAPQAVAAEPVPDPATDKPQPLVTVIVPTLNEAENLPHVLPLIPDEYEVIVVDGGSVDDTVEVAARLRPTVRILRQPGRGKGDALTCGFAAASGEIVVAFDADGSARAEEIPRFVEALRQGADFAKGSRFYGDGGSADITRVRRVGNRFLSSTANLLFRTRFTDLCYGFNAFWTRCLPQLQLDADGFEVEAQMNLRAAKAGLRIVEVASFEDQRGFGTSNLHPFRDGTRVLRTILVERLTRRVEPPHAPTPTPSIVDVPGDVLLEPTQQ